MCPDGRVNNVFLIVMPQITRSSSAVDVLVASRCRFQAVQPFCRRCERRVPAERLAPGCRGLLATPRLLEDLPEVERARRLVGPAAGDVYEERRRPLEVRPRRPLAPIDRQVEEDL